MDGDDRIRADFDAADHELADVFESFIADQEADGRAFEPRERMVEFFEWHCPEIDDDLLDAEVDAALAGGAALRRSKMD